MKRNNRERDASFRIGTVVLRTVGILLVFTMLSMSLVSETLAKYIVTDSIGDSAHVAKTGVLIFGLWEHKADEGKTANGGPSGEYELNDNYEVKKNEYLKVLPGVDIPKDPFVRLEIRNADVSYELYMKVVKSDPFSEHVTYEIEDVWELIDEANGIYKYISDFDAHKDYDFTNGNEIPILKNDLIYVSEHYVGNGEDFALSFEAWLKQKAP